MFHVRVFLVKLRHTFWDVMSIPVWFVAVVLFLGAWAGVFAGPILLGVFKGPWYTFAAVPLFLFGMWIMVAVTQTVFLDSDETRAFKRRLEYQD